MVSVKLVIIVDRAISSNYFTLGVVLWIDSPELTMRVPMLNLEVLNILDLH